MLRNDGRCFACGKDNSAGLRLEFSFSADGIAETVFAPGEAYQGWQGMVHGGILMTVLDEVMAKAAVHRGLQVVTGEMTVKLKIPARIGEPLRFRGWVREVKKRIVYADAAALGQDGATVAESTAKLFVLD